MTKKNLMWLRGSNSFRQRLLLSTLSTKPIQIEDIRSKDASPGLRPHEISLLRLFERISDDCVVEINETGTKLRYKPGIIIGGKNIVHDCGLTRSIGYFLEPLILVSLFGKRPLSIRLQGITNDTDDPSTDTFRMATLHILKRFGVPLEGLHLETEKRGAPPLGGGEVLLKVPIVQDSLKATHWIDEGMVKRIRGVTFSTRLSPRMETHMREKVREVFNRFLPDVYIFSDHKSGQLAGRSPGYGVSLVAETTTDCYISADYSVNFPRVDEVNAMEDSDEKPELMTPEDLGVQVASMLLGEIEKGGVVDSTHQGFLFLLCALCPPDVSKVRVGKLTPYAVETLRNIRDFLGVKFVITPEPTTNTVVLKCVGSGMKNLSRKIT